MSDKFNIDKFLSDEPKENDKHPQNRLTDIKAGGVPDDIKRIAAQAMIEQETPPFSDGSQFAQSEHHFQDTSLEEEYPNALKISNIRFMGLRPEKEAVSEKVKPEKTIEKSQSPQDFEEMNAFPEIETEAFLSNQRPFQSQQFERDYQYSEPQEVKQEFSKKSSFGKDLMARLRPEEPVFNENMPEVNSFNPEFSNFQDASLSNLPPSAEQYDESLDVHQEAASYDFRNSTHKTEGQYYQEDFDSPSFSSYDEEQDKGLEPIANRSERVKFEREVDEMEQVGHRRKSNSHFGRNLAIAFILFVLILAGGSYAYLANSLKAVDPTNTTVKVIEIPSNTSIKGVSKILEDNNLVKSAFIFNYYTQFSGNSSFQSGTFELSESMTAEEIAEALQTFSSVPSTSGKIMIPEGYTIDQMSTAITVNAGSESETSTPYLTDDFLQLMNDQTFIDEMAGKYPQLFESLPTLESGVKYRLEGYLFPATYEYDANTTLEGLVEQMIQAMDQNLQPLYPQIAEMGFDVNKFLSLSALVEKEANSEEDRKNVADVFLKRLDTGMTLGSNVALLYIEGKLGTEVTMEEDANVDTLADSPFNLYQHQGTGPGPVASSSLMSMEAVVDHTPNEYLYFIADPTTGEVYFAENQEQHDANIAEYLSN